MLDSVKIARRQSEIRQTLSELVGKEKPSEDETRQMDEMDREYRSNETRYRAALIAEDQERREAGADLETRSDREWAEVMAGFEMRQVALALDEGRALEGQTGEIVTELRSPAVRPTRSAPRRSLNGSSLDRSRPAWVARWSTWAWVISNIPLPRPV